MRATETESLEALAPVNAPYHKSDADLEESLRFTSAIITRSLEADLSKQLGEQAASLAQVVKRVLVWWLDPRRDLRRGDRLGIVWQPRTDAEPAAHAVWLQSEKLKTQKAAVLYHPNGAPFPRWVDEQGQEIALRLVHAPIRNYEQITALVNDGRGHKGVDFKAPEGTPVFAPFAGEIRRINWSTRSNGRCVEIYNPRTGRSAIFLHLSRIAKGVRRGARVARGARIGDVGNTGRSFAPHLHYQLEKNGRVLDPFRVQATKRGELPERERPRAQARLRSMESLRVGWN